MPWKSQQNGSYEQVHLDMKNELPGLPHDVYLVELDPAKVHEIQKNRTLINYFPDEMNHNNEYSYYCPNDNKDR